MPPMGWCKHASATSIHNLTTCFLVATLGARSTVVATKHEKVLLMRICARERWQGIRRNRRRKPAEEKEAGWWKETREAPGAAAAAASEEEVADKAGLHSVCDAAACIGTSSRAQFPMSCMR